MSKHGVFTTLLHYRANTVLLKNLPRWRADSIRPPTWRTPPNYRRKISLRK